jgi:hypothetical protein
MYKLLPLRGDDRTAFTSDSHVLTLLCMLLLCMNIGCCGLVPALNASHLLQADYAGGQARALASYQVPLHITLLLELECGCTQRIHAYIVVSFQLQPVACRKIARLLRTTAANTFDAGVLFAQHWY